jgi:hypothetical protein
LCAHQIEACRRAFAVEQTNKARIAVLQHLVGIDRQPVDADQVVLGLGVGQPLVKKLGDRGAGLDLDVIGEAATRIFLAVVAGLGPVSMPGFKASNVNCGDASTIGNFALFGMDFSSYAIPYSRPLVLVTTRLDKIARLRVRGIGTQHGFPNRGTGCLSGGSCGSVRTGYFYDRSTSHGAAAD